MERARCDTVPRVKSVRIGLLGVGTVGRSVARALAERRDVLSRAAGAPLLLQRAAVRDVSRDRGIDAALLTADARSIVQANAKALLAKAPPRLGDWAPDLDDAGCAQALGEDLTAMADACEHWPALWQHAAEQGDKLLSAV